MGSKIQPDISSKSSLYLDSDFQRDNAGNKHNLSYIILISTMVSLLLTQTHQHVSHYKNDRSTKIRYNSNKGSTKPCRLYHITFYFL